MSVVIVNPPRPILIEPGRPPAYMNHVFFGSTTTFKFPASPLEVSFSNISSAYQEVPRPGRYPILIFEELALTRANLSFRLFDKSSGGAVSVEGEMKKLRNMATAPGYVWFQGIDKMLQEPIQPVLLDGGTSRNTAWWRITDFSMDVVYRNELNQATQVDCEIQFTEERNPTIPTLVLPAISYAPDPPRSTPAKTTKAKAKAKASTKKKKSSGKQPRSTASGTRGGRTVYQTYDDNRTRTQ